MTEEQDWDAATWEGNRRAQHRRFRALPLAEKLIAIEQMTELAALLEVARRAHSGVQSE